MGSEDTGEYARAYVPGLETRRSECALRVSYGRTDHPLDDHGPFTSFLTALPKLLRHKPSMRARGSGWTGMESPGQLGIALVDLFVAGHTGRCRHHDVLPVHSHKARGQIVQVA